jgi:hypothetical protein
MDIKSKGRTPQAAGGLEACFFVSSSPRLKDVVEWTGFDEVDELGQYCDEKCDCRMRPALI